MIKPLPVVVFLLATACASKTDTSPNTDPSTTGAATYVMSGRVTDGTSGEGLLGALVSVLDGVNQNKRAQTDTDGSYSLPGLAAGTFNVSTSNTGYQTATKSVTLLSDIRIDFIMRGLTPPTLSQLSDTSPMYQTISQ